MTHNLLKGKRGIIFGALNEDSIAWKVAKKAAEEGAQITLSNTPMALRMGTLDKLAEEIGATIIPADATNVDDLTNVFQKSMEVLGGKIDFVLHSIGMSPNVRKHRTYDDLDYGYLQKTLDISAISFHKYARAEIQLRTVAMDFWASLEHDLRYKSTKNIPEDISREMFNCADEIAAIDVRMQRIYKQIQKL